MQKIYENEREMVQKYKSTILRDKETGRLCYVRDVLSQRDFFVDDGVNDPYVASVDNLDDDVKEPGYIPFPLTQNRGSLMLFVYRKPIRRTKQGCPPESLYCTINNQEVPLSSLFKNTTETLRVYNLPIPAVSRHKKVNIDIGDFLQFVGLSRHRAVFQDWMVSYFVTADGSPACEIWFLGDAVATISFRVSGRGLEVTNIDFIKKSAMVYREVKALVNEIPKVPAMGGRARPRVAPQFAGLGVAGAPNPLDAFNPFEFADRVIREEQDDEEV